MNDWITLAWSKVVYKKKNRCKNFAGILTQHCYSYICAKYVFVLIRVLPSKYLLTFMEKSIKTKHDNIRWDYKSLTFVTPDYTTWSHSQPVFSLRYRRYCIFVSLLYAFLFLFIFLRALPCFFNFFTASE